VLLILGYLSWAAFGRADTVADWNSIAVQAVLGAGAARPGASGLLDLATVHAAVFDAVEAIDGRFKPYHVNIPGASGSPAAAAATAAHDVLVNRFPAQTASLDATYNLYFLTHGLSLSDPGVAVGHQAAAGIIVLRANDGSFPVVPPPPFVGDNNPGDWRPTMSYLPGPPPSFAPMLIPWLATMTPFTLTSPSQFRAEPPPPLNSERYTQAYNEVKALGSLSSTARTAEQTDLAYFWAANYLVVWNQVFRDLASAHLQNLGDSARLFALANLAMADAAITAWDTKRFYHFWRPLSAIQEGDNDGNPHTVGDVNWRPLLNTPNYPDYTSGANNVTGAATQMLELFFGTDEMSFSTTTTNPAAIQQTRTYNRFSDAAKDVVNARILEGIHFRFADATGRKQGRAVAKWAFKHFLRPVSDVDSDDEDNQRDDQF
jgi:hypothetical protein